MPGPYTDPCRGEACLALAPHASHSRGTKPRGHGTWPLHLGVYGVNQGVDIAITESVGLKLTRIVRMTRHMIGAD